MMIDFLNQVLKSLFKMLKITIFREKAWAKTKIATNIKIEIKKIDFNIRRLFL